MDSLDKFAKEHQYKIALIGFIIAVIGIFQWFFSISIEHNTYVSVSEKTKVVDSVQICIERKGTNNTICSYGVQVPSPNS